ncbi:hypothetical protein JW890_03265 [candidate division WOR-3 bacterium]|nr:hypothetical protein [candidate division WOR-3 bacterium]
MKLFIVIILFSATPILSQREDRMRDLEAIRLWEMAQYMELTEDQIASAIRIHREYSELTSLMHSRRAQIIDELKTELSANVREEKLNALVEEIADIDRNFHSIKEEEREKMFETLTPAQRAKFYIFQIEFAKRIRENLRGPR